MLFVMGVGFLLDSPLIVVHGMCVFRLWSQCPSRCSFHMPDLCVCMAWLMSLFKCSSLFCNLLLLPFSIPVIVMDRHVLL